MEQKELDRFLKKLEMVKDELPPDIYQVLKDQSPKCSKQGLKSLILYQQKKMVSFCLELDWLSSSI